MKDREPSDLPGAGTLFCGILMRDAEGPGRHAMCVRPVPCSLHAKLPMSASAKARAEQVIEEWEISEETSRSAIEHAATLIALIARAIAEARAEERAACADIADQHGYHSTVAQAIRERGNR